MIVKVQISWTKPSMALIYDEHNKWQGQFPAAMLPRKVLDVFKGINMGKAYFRAEMRGTKIELFEKVKDQYW